MAKLIYSKFKRNITTVVITYKGYTLYTTGTETIVYADKERLHTFNGNISLHEAKDYVDEQIKALIGFEFILDHLICTIKKVDEHIIYYAARNKAGDKLNDQRLSVQYMTGVVISQFKRRPVS